MANKQRETNETDAHPTDGKDYEIEYMERLSFIKTRLWAHLKSLSTRPAISKAAAGTGIADETAKPIRQMVTGLEQVAKLVSEIAAASGQAGAIAHVDHGIEQIAQVVSGELCNFLGNGSCQRGALLAGGDIKGDGGEIC